MTLADERLRELDDPALPSGERALQRCRAAADFIFKGQYEAAREALGGLWPGAGQRPRLEGLPPAAAAEVLLQCGTLAGWLGSSQNLAGAQESAQDLISEALREFDLLGRRAKAAEARYELGMCYWRLGQFDEARVVMREALGLLSDADSELKARILIRRTLVEVWENKHYEALDILREAEPVFSTAGDALKGRWHGQKALVLNKLATAEGSAEHADRAIIEYTAAIYHYEQARHERYCGNNLNNLAMLLYRLGRYAEAHEHLDRAEFVFTRLKDHGTLAQVDETRVRVLIAERKYREADRVVAGVIKTLEQGCEAAPLADALTLQGLVWARLGAFENSVRTLRRAVETAEGAGAHNGAGLAALTLIEEHGAVRLSANEVAKLYLRADRLLKGTQDAEDITRLRACARTAVRRLTGMQLHDKNFSLYGAVHELEARLIERALEEAEGSVVKAARLLGLKHQTFSSMLTKRHKRLLGKRTPPEKRRRSIIKGPKE